MLRSLSISQGGRVFTILGRKPKLYATMIHCGVSDVAAIAVHAGAQWRKLAPRERRQSSVVLRMMPNVGLLIRPECSAVQS